MNLYGIVFSVPICKYVVSQLADLFEPNKAFFLFNLQFFPLFMTIIMSIVFFYENDQGEIIDEKEYQ
jgi:hypothetical protein